MGFDNKIQVIRFDRRDDHPGYILIRTIDKGLQSQTTLVRSLQDGQVYIRKHLHEKENTGADLLVRNLQANVAPKLVDYTSTLDPNENEDVFIYQICNGGDLADFLTKLVHRFPEKQFLPGALLWDLARQYVGRIAYIHSGWREGKGAQGGWEPIIHGDISQSNTFLHWDETGSAYPEILLGDWGRARKIKEPKGRDMAKWREYQLEDLRCLLETLGDIDIEAQIRTPDSTNPTAYDLYEKIGADGKKWELEEQNSGSSIAGYVADRFVARARVRIRDFESQGTQEDLRWTMPDEIQGFARFDKSSPPPAIKEPWEWMDLDQIPTIANSN